MTEVPVGWGRAGSFEPARSRWRRRDRDSYNSAMSASARATLSSLLWGASVLVFAVHVAGLVRAGGVPISGNDFPAFYCAGKALVAHADPYAIEPLRSCEHALPRGSDLPDAYVTPAPLPPYALDLFALLAQLPYRAAAWLAFAVLALASIVLAVALARVTGIPSGAIACSLLLSAGLASVVFGQIPPLVTLAIVLCGLALLRGDDAAASVCAAGAMIEPHVGLPVAASLFFLRPATRGWLAGFALLFAAASALAVTPHGAIEYVAQVLPAQARAELLAVDQFSLSHVLARAGATERVALALGTLSYLLTLVLGVLAANLASRRLDVAAIAYVPAAIALLAGTFVHEIQLVAALPAAYLCIARGTSPLAWAGRFVVAVVATMPFTIATDHRPLLDAFALFAGTGALVGAIPIGDPFDVFPALGGFVLAAACVAFPLAVERVALPQLPARVAVRTPAATDGDASDNWGAYLHSDPRYDAPRLDAEVSKLPVWLGLLTLLASLLGMGMAGLGPRTQAAWDPRPRIHLTS